MPDLYMVRHGKAAARWAEHLDSSLDETGHKQAKKVADRLAQMHPINIISSPLARTKETAQYLCDLWDTPPVIEPRVAEIPSPDMNLKERSVWLRQAMVGSWDDLGKEYIKWRQDLWQCLLLLQEDTVIFSHFIAINSVVAQSQNSSKVVVFSPDNCSVTLVQTDANGIHVKKLGAELSTKVN